jgi:hypothetical protein
MVGNVKDRRQEVVVSAYSSLESIKANGSSDGIDHRELDNTGLCRG